MTLTPAGRTFGWMTDLVTDQPNFKPSDVNLCDSFPPLVGTLGRFEAEITAALLVRACQVRGDAWQDVDLRTLSEVVGRDIIDKRDPIYTMTRNPFCRPDPSALVAIGGAEWVGNPGKVLRFTAKGFDGLREVVECSPIAEEMLR